MRTTKEIDEEIVREYSYMNQLYAQIDSYEQSIKHLKAEREDVKKEEEKQFIDNWLNEHFGILNQKEGNLRLPRHHGGQGSRRELQHERHQEGRADARKAPRHEALRRG